LSLRTSNALKTLVSSEQVRFKQPSETGDKVKTKKRSSVFEEKIGVTHQLPPRVTPTLVTPLMHHKTNVNTINYTHTIHTAG